MVMAATELVKNHKSVIPTVGKVSDMTKKVHVTHYQLLRPLSRAMIFKVRSFKPHHVLCKKV